MVKGIVFNVLNWFKWSPMNTVPLPALKKSHQEEKSDYQMSNQTKIVIRITSAINIPEREKSKAEVSPFVEVEYNNLTTRTKNSKGSNPIWNEDLTLDLECLHTDYLNPHSLNGTIFVNIFDEDTDPNLENLGERRKYYLGCLEIPLSAICYNRVSKVNLPSNGVIWDKR